MLYDEKHAENMIMSMVNATVSHEIRNPINSISCQNTIIKLLVDRIDDLLEQLGKPGFCEERIAERLRRIRRSIGKALLINISSEKLISFLVEDFLDLGQLRAGRFRLVSKTFAVRQPVEEVISILSFKAAHKSINIETKYIDVEPTT